MSTSKPRLQIQLRPAKTRCVSPAKMKDDELAAYVETLTGRFTRLSEELKPYFSELRHRFHTKPKNAKIGGCASWDEFCSKKLDRTRRALNYFLGPKREQSSHQDTSPAEPVGTPLHIIPVKIKTATTDFNYVTVHYSEPEPEPIQKASTFLVERAPSLQETYGQIDAVADDIIKTLRAEIKTANINPDEREEFGDRLAERLMVLAHELRRTAAFIQ
jgi:hypothetical protein